MSDVEIVVSDKYVSRGGFGRAKKEVKDLGRDIKDADSASKGLGKSLGGLPSVLGDVGAKAGGALKDGLSKGVSAAGEALPKILSNAPLAGAAAGVGILAGAALSGALIAGVGAGLAGLGMKVAAEAPGVKGAITSLKQDIGAEMATIAQPFEKTWKDITVSARRGFEEIKPALSSMFADVAPSVSGFGDNLSFALSRFKTAIPPIGGAFKAVLSDLGGRLPGIIDGLADSFASLARSVEKNPKALGDAIFLVGKLGEVAIGTAGFLNDIYEGAKENLLPDSVTRFMDAWGQLDKLEAAKENFDKLSESGSKTTPAMRSVAAAITEVGEAGDDTTKKASALRVMMDQLSGQTPDYTEGLSAAAEAVSQIGKDFFDADTKAKGFGSTLMGQSGAFDVTNENGRELHDQVRDVASAFDDMAAAVSSGQGSREDYISQTNRMRDRLNETWRQAGLNESQINSLNHAYQLTPQQISTRLDLLGVSAAQGMINGFINMNNGRTISIYTSVLGSGGLASAGRLATGGISSTAHAATGGARGGDTIMNEQGPENVRLPNGSTVINAGTTRRLEQQMFSGGTGGGASVLEVVATGRMTGLEQMFVEWLKTSVRKRGGKPEVFG